MIRVATGTIPAQMIDFHFRWHFNPAPHQRSAVRHNLATAKIYPDVPIVIFRKIKNPATIYTIKTAK
jgi:hypothetical protein